MRFLFLALLLLFNSCDVDAQRVLKGSVPPIPNTTAVVYIFAGQSNQPEAISTYFEALMDAATDKRVVVIWWAQAGATMLGEGGTNDWKVSETSSGTHYATLKSTILTALADVVADGYTPEIRGFDWMQGEAESNGVSGYTAVTLQADWTLQFTRLLQFIADDINEAGYDVHNMRVTVGRIHATYPTSDGTMLTAIRAAQVDMNNFNSTYAGYSDLVKSVAWRDTDSYSRDGGGVHLSVPTGQHQVAQALYDYYSPYINETNTLTTINTSGFDSDAIEYLSATQCHNQSDANALNTWTGAAKANGYWTSCVAIYPLLGGHRVAHRANLKNPANTDGAYRLTFNKGVSHTDLGFYGDASAGYAETYVTETSLGQNTAGFFVYSNTSAQEAKYGMGILNSGNTSRLYWAIRWTDNLNYPANMSGEQTGITNTDGSGLFVNTRTSSSNFNTYIRGTKRSYSVTSVAPDANTFTLGARNANGTKNSFSSRVWGPFGLCNVSLSDANELSLRSDITTFQTAVR